MRAHLVLLGFGHAHIEVLKVLGRARQKPTDPTNPNSVVDARITVVSPYASLVHPAMLPGWIAGHYNLAECEISLQPLCEAARAQWVQSRVVAIDRVKKTVALLDGQALSYDFLSINTGAAANADALPGAREHGLLLRPIPQFIAQWETVCAQISNQASAEKHAHSVVIGGGASGVEIALAARHHFLRPGFHVGVTLVSDFSHWSAAAEPMIAAACKREGVSVVRGQRVVGLTEGAALLESGGEIVGDYFIVATGCAAMPYLRASSLDCDSQGYVRINAALQSITDSAIFAAGDCATLEGDASDKSGVYATHAGAVLAANLMRALQGTTLKNHQPISNARYLISTGAKHAISIKGNTCSSGAWLWHWKNFLDRRFIANGK